MNDKWMGHDKRKERERKGAKKGEIYQNSIAINCQSIKQLNGWRITAHVNTRISKSAVYRLVMIRGG